MRLGYIFNTILASYKRRIYTDKTKIAEAYDFRSTVGTSFSNSWSLS